MQGIGFIRDGNKTIKLLVRQSKYGRYLKLRKAGKDGIHFEDEEIFLTKYDRDRLKDLLNGETVYC